MLVSSLYILRARFLAASVSAIAQSAVQQPKIPSRELSISDRVFI
jgi:hypothetical protein